MKIFIKNMVCDRCIMVVRSEMDKLGHMVDQISLGEVTLQKDLTHDEKIKLDKALKSVGFRLIEEKRTQLVEQIKTLIIELIHHRQEDSDLNYSDYLSQKLLHDYKYLSSLFSESEGLTIEKYIIFQK